MATTSNRIEYRWKPGRPKPDVDPETFGGIMEELEQQAIAEGRGVRPDDIVETAAQRKSPIHHLFEWNDKLAAHEHRKQQARHLVGALVVTKVIVLEQEVPVRQFFAVKAPGGAPHTKGYRSLPNILGSADLTKQMIKNSRAELERFLIKFTTVCRTSAALPLLAEALAIMQDDLDMVAAEAGLNKHRPKPQPMAAE